MTVIKTHHLRDGYTYEEYRQMGKDLLSQGKTTGPNQSESYLQYSSLNDHRMDRLDKMVQLVPEAASVLSRLKGKQYWLVISELWCGDAAQNLPVLAKLVNATTHIEMRIILRDENPEVMEAYLTNGTRSIPKLIVLGEKLEELWTWGPRPAGAQKLMDDFKASGGADKNLIITEIQKWYNADNGVSVQKEILELLAQQM